MTAREAMEADRSCGMTFFRGVCVGVGVTLVAMLWALGCKMTPRYPQPVSKPLAMKPQRSLIDMARLGDLNCDGTLNFDDINPFVLYLSDNAAWQAAYPGCPLINGDMNGDGRYGQNETADVAGFVSALNGRPIAYLITGRIVDQDGNPVTGATVQLDTRGPNP